MLLMILQKHFVPFQNCSQTLKLKYFSANPILLLIILPNNMSYTIHWSPVLWTKSVQGLLQPFLWRRCPLFLFALPGADGVAPLHHHPLTITWISHDSSTGRQPGEETPTMTQIYQLKNTRKIISRQGNCRNIKLKKIILRRGNCRNKKIQEK